MARTHHVLRRISTQLRSAVRKPSSLPKRPLVRASSTSAPTPTPRPPPRKEWLPHGTTTEQAKALDNLWRMLHHGGGHNRVWRAYSNALQAMGALPLPHRFHVWVLRQCTPDIEAHRRHLRRRLSDGKFDGTKHEHEDRMLSVLHNMRADGNPPSRSDYDFVLRQFGSVGYVDGAVSLYKQSRASGSSHSPGERTFTHLFYALAMRHTLPMLPVQRLDLVANLQSLLDTLLADMRAANVPMTAEIMDLVLRTLKVSIDPAAIDSLLRWSYGIDVRNPDKLALEYAQPNPEHIPFAFDTAALNTTLDLIGRTGNVSRLVQYFEVLTNPLPSPARVDALEADEDDDWGVSVPPATSSIPIPSASPNTTSYVTLIRYICRENHATLARHYLVQALDLHRRVAGKLSSDVNFALRRRKLDMSGVRAPHFAINRGMVLPLLGLGNRDKDMGVLRWLKRKMPGMIKMQKEALHFFTWASEELARKQAKAAEAAARMAPKAATSTSTTLDPPTPDSPQPPTTNGRRKRGAPRDVDQRVSENPAVDPSSSPASSSTSSKPSSSTTSQASEPFDMATHMNILSRNISELTALSERVDFVLTRSTQRHKERIGRRVWEGKDVYFHTPPKGSILKDGKEVPDFFADEKRRAPTANTSSAAASSSTRPTRADEKLKVDEYAARLREEPAFQPQRVRVSKEAWKDVVNFRELPEDYEELGRWARAKGPRIGPRARRQAEEQKAARLGSNVDAVVEGRGASGRRKFSTAAVDAAGRTGRIDVPPSSMVVLPVARGLSSHSLPMASLLQQPRPPILSQAPTFLTKFSLSSLLSSMLSVSSASRS